MQTKERLASEGIEWQDTIDLYQPLDDYCGALVIILL